MSILPWTQVQAQETPENPDSSWGCVMEYRNGSDQATERCGYGTHRTICSGGVDGEQCDTFFELDEEEESSGASNVLFLPGIKGSRLYGGSGEKLWEPFGNHDVEALMLDTDGTSLRSDIHTRPGDIVDRIGGVIDIYGSFMEFMDGLAEDGTINEWRAVPYDWRLSLPEIVRTAFASRQVMPNVADENPYTQNILKELADTSNTGKVTIVAHSNGGLVAKEFMRTLGDAETARLIDKVIFVGVPQSGAPQALGALLYGYKEGLPWWFPGIVSTATARTFAENSPMGYHLLPSERYFQDVQDSYHALASFDSGIAYAEERAAYGTLIESFDELTAYALAEDGGRTKPVPTRIDQANVLNAGLLEYARTTYASLDAWVPPEGVTIYQIAGWGEDTIAGIEHYEQCIFSLCREMYRPTFVEDGDGVVPVPSALMMSEAENVKRYWLNLRRISIGFIGKRDHGDLLAARDLQSFILTILEDEPRPDPEIIRETQPRTEAPEKQLRFFLHSPLTLGLSDLGGNRAGIDAHGTEHQGVAGAQYGQLGDVQYLIVPHGGDYELELHGYDSGTFSLEVQEIEGDEIQEMSFVEIPTTEDTVARMSIDNQGNDAYVLNVDTDGDDVFDIRLNASPGESVTRTVSVVTADDSRRGHSRTRVASRASDSEQALLELYLQLLRLLLEYLHAESARNVTYAPI